MSRYNFDSETDISGLDDSQLESSEGSRESESPSSSPSQTSRTHQEALADKQKVAAYYNGFNDGGRYV